MEAEQPETALRDELRQVDEELAQLRPAAEELRRRIGERWDTPGDPADTATALTAVEEQEALIARLEGRREDLLRRLSEG